MTLPPIERPNGGLYRPRKLIAMPVGDEWDEDTGIVVLGTHDVEQAKPIAEKAGRDLYGTQYVTFRYTVWWRDGFEGGRRSWVHDPVNGRAGVYFTCEDDPPPTVNKENSNAVVGLQALQERPPGTMPTPM